MHWLIVASIFSVVQVSLQGDITRFSQIPNGTVESGTIVTFNCQATGNDVTWFVNGVRRDVTHSDYNISHEPTNHHEDWNITLTTRASIDKNNTRIQCYAGGPPIARRYGIITIGVPPESPSVLLTVLDEGTILNISWERPYSPTGFPIVSYNLTLHNIAANTSDFLLQEKTQTYFLMNKTGNENCSMLNFTVTARNSVGVSDEGFVVGGFPVFPQTDGVIMQASLLVRNGILTILVEFQACALEVCAYQDPANYTLDIVNENNEIVDSTGTKEACTATTETFTVGIDASQSYTARLMITQRHFIKHTVLNTVIPKFDPGADSGNRNLLIISMVSLGVALSVCVALAITIVTACGCCYKRGRRPTISEHIIEVPLQSSNEFKLASPSKGKANRVPSSLPTKQAVNPIYEGPMYDSPSGESFKLLLGSSSVASTPSTPMGESCRYFDMPPNLPPPRRASARAHPLSPVTPEEPNDISNGEYAEMKPLSCTVARPPDVPLAVYEAMGGEYAVIRK